MFFVIVMVMGYGTNFCNYFFQGRTTTKQLPVRAARPESVMPFEPKSSRRVSHGTGAVCPREPARYGQRVH